MEGLGLKIAVSKTGAIYLRDGKREDASHHLEIVGEAVKASWRVKHLRMVLDPALCFQDHLVAAARKAEISIKALMLMPRVTFMQHRFGTAP